eukprot:1147204-Pelagomonas_calceolata.AAC.1
MLDEEISPAADQPKSWAVGHPLVWNSSFSAIILLSLLVAGPVFFLCLPCFSQSELRGGWVIRSVHQCGPLSLTDVGSVSMPTHQAALVGRYSYATLPHPCRPSSQTTWPKAYHIFFMLQLSCPRRQSKFCELSISWPGLVTGLCVSAQLPRQQAVIAM